MKQKSTIIFQNQNEIKKYKIRLNWFDGTSSFMYGLYSEKDIDSIIENLKREPNKRLYRYGTRFDLVRGMDIIEEAN